MRKHVKKYIINVILSVSSAFLLVLLCTCNTVAKEACIENFTDIYQYSSNMFSDVSESDSFAKAIETVVRKGIMSGISYKLFRPYKTLSIKEAYDIVARIHCIYNYGNSRLGLRIVSNDPTGYLIKEGVTAKAIDYDTKITSADFIYLLSSALPDYALEKINSIQAGTIEDVPSCRYHAEAVYKFYEAGILAFNGETNMFYPRREVTRAFAAEILCRVVDPDQRVVAEYPNAASERDYIYAEDVFYLMNVGRTYFINIYEECLLDSEYVIVRSSDYSVVDAFIDCYPIDGIGQMCIVGKKEGSAFIDIMLCDENGCVATDRIEVVVKNGTKYTTNTAITVSNKVLKIEKKRSKGLTVSFNMPLYSENVSFRFVIDNENIASAKWNTFSKNNSNELIITGISEGQTVIYIEMFDEYTGEYIDNIEVLVKIIPFSPKDIQCIMA